VSGTGPAALSPTEESQYRAAIEQARNGQSAQALDVLRSLQGRHPERLDIFNDYVVVLGWAGSDAAALALQERVDRDAAPAYVLENLGGSARRQKQYALAEELYAKARARFPQRIEPQLGLVATWVDAGRLDDAARLAGELRAGYPRDARVLAAYAEVATARRDYFGALGAYQEMLAQSPADRTALQGKARTLARMGAPQLALEIERTHPGVLSPAEVAGLSADRTAHQVRWGRTRADQGYGPERFAELDRALAESDAAAARALAPATPLTAAERQLALDRISALRARYRMSEAVALYEAMAARPEPVPFYVKSDAAAAYLYLHQPERARDLYREVVAADPANTNAGMGLFYALAESEEHAAALAQIEKLAAATPRTINAYSAATTEPNPQYISVQTARAMAPLLANRPGEAWARMRDISAQAPSNMEAGTAYASTMSARGWPRLAERELRRALALDPYDGGALGEHAETLLEMRDYRAAETELARAQALAAEDERVRRAGELAAVHQMRELDVEAAYGRSSGGPTGNRDYVVDAHLYSSPLDYNYRAFTHLFSAQGKYDTGTGRYDRAGIGLEYRSPRYIARGELTQDLNRGRTGVSGAVGFTPDDFWTFSGVVESSSTATSVQARLAGVDARRYGVEAAWRASESRSAAVGLSRLDYSDGNKRDVLEAHWTERVIAGPVYRLEVTGAVETSHASSTNVAYFNPARDIDSSVQLTNEWLQWRRYNRSFRHRVILTAGNYWQQSFGSGPAYSARYEQEWSADYRVTVRYGIGRSLHPYDGVQSARNFAYVSFNWRF